MKVAIYGQYYQNSTEPIIKTSSFFLIKQCGIIEAAFLEPLWKEIIKKEYKTFLPTRN
jgi:NAD+ kinase